MEGSIEEEPLFKEWLELKEEIKDREERKYFQGGRTRSSDHFRIGYL